MAKNPNKKNEKQNNKQIKSNSPKNIDKKNSKLKTKKFLAFSLIYFDCNTSSKDVDIFPFLFFLLTLIERTLVPTVLL